MANILILITKNQQEMLQTYCRRENIDYDTEIEAWCGVVVGTLIYKKILNEPKGFPQQPISFVKERGDDNLVLYAGRDVNLDDYDGVHLNGMFIWDDNKRNFLKDPEYAESKGLVYNCIILGN